MYVCNAGNKTQGSVSPKFVIKITPRSHYRRTEGAFKNLYNQSPFWEFYGRVKKRSNSFDQIPVRINENIVLTANVSKSSP